MVLDPATLAAGEAYLVRDSTLRRRRAATAVIVNGEVVPEDRKHTGAPPGHVLRGA